MNKAFLHRGEEIAKKKAEEDANRVVLTAESFRGLMLLPGDPNFIKLLVPFECGLTLDMHFFSKGKPVRFICSKMYGEHEECEPCTETSSVFDERTGKTKSIPNKPKLVKSFPSWNFNYGPDGVERTSERGNKYVIYPHQIADIPAGEGESHWNKLRQAAKNGSLEKYIYKLEVIKGDGFQPPTVPVQEELEEIVTDLTIKPEVLKRFELSDHIRKLLSEFRQRDWQPREDGTDYHDDPQFAAYRNMVHQVILEGCANVRWEAIGLEKPARREEAKQAEPAGKKKNAAKDLNKKSDD